MMNFVKNEFQSVLAGAGARGAFEVNSNGGGVLYEWAINQEDNYGENTPHLWRHRGA